MKNAHGRELSAEEIDRLHEELLLEVEAVQLEQMALLRCLIKHHGLKRIFSEGLAANDLPANRERIAVLTSRFHALVRQGVFPKAVKAGQGRRPHYSHELVQRCVEIRSTGIGENGQITLFNRPPKRHADRKRAAITPAPSEHDGLIDALQGLGLSATEEAVAAAVLNVFPGGTSGVEESEIIRKVFVFLQRNRR
jgi:hypothetical protein